MGRSWRFSVVVLTLAMACAEEQGARFAPPDAGPDAGFDAGGCQTDPQCDDRIACTVDHCRAGACEHTPCTDCCPEGLMCSAGFGCGPARRACTTDAECADGVRCTLDRCQDGRFCENVPQSGLCDNGQVCFAALGCIVAPPATCARDQDCERTRCGGRWTCQPELGCAFRARTDCDDRDACTTDRCDDAQGCLHTPRDGDNDTHGDRRCGGDDCDDSNPDVHPGARELCGNNRDDDCDGMTDEGCCAGDVPCTTTCGSTGRTGCGDAGSACIPPAEVCNGRDDDCDNAPDNGLGCVMGSAEACATACGSMGTRSCSTSCVWGVCAPPAETCNGRDDDCDGTADNGFACVARSTGACTTSCGSMGTRMCLGNCTWEACAPPPETCNGRDDDCDGMTDEGCCSNGGACTTSCGSTGQTSCGDGGVRCIPPAESCNGRDDDCDGMTDEGCCTNGGACTTACGSTGRTSCGDAGVSCIAPAEVCNGRDDDCDGARDNGFACLAGSTGSCTTSCGSTGTRTCLGNCAWDTCTPPRETCNGVDDNCNASCDEGFSCCARSTRDCTALGFSRGTATCRGDCTGWDTSACDNCGNRVRDGLEQCDAADLGGQRCDTRGFGGGTLRCNSNCTFDTSMCTTCGNNRAEGAEVCDGTDLRSARCDTLGMGFSGGTLRCTTGCALDTSMCTRTFDPSGTWSVAPAFQYRCALAFGVIYLVDLNVSTLALSDSGGALTASHSSVPCVMTGPSARSSRMVNATCTARGSCNETYTLTGTFGTDNRFTGTLTAAFAGTNCADCTMQSRSVTLTR
jgi:hypothetical protein